MSFLKSLFGVGGKPKAADPPLPPLAPPPLPPVYDIDGILAKATASESVCALMQAIESARTGKKMIGHERVIYHPHTVHLSILYDGIHSTLFNLGLGRLFWAHDGMEKLKAVKRARILKEVLDSLGGGEKMKELAQKFSLSMVTPKHEQLFDELGTRYYETEEDFDELVVQYVKQHIEDFRSYQNPPLPAQGDAPNERHARPPVARPPADAAHR